MSRCAGILMSISSLPSPYGIGTIGQAAYDFADFLKAAGQKIWQILPVGPTSYGDSPYQSFSTYAGNPYFIDLDFLVRDGLLTEKDLEGRKWGENPEEVDYAQIYETRFDVLRCAFKRFKKSDADYKAFVKENADWLENYALYMSVKKNNDMKAWTEWADEDIKLRKPEAVANYTKELKPEIDFWKFVQFIFYKQWADFRAYVNSLGIQIMGDMPIYVAMDSADTWANSEVFWLDEEKLPVCVAGCPPDYFSATGQLWGNPLYNWEYLKETNYKWWFARIKSASNLFDIVRIDHFRAFDSYYAIPYPAENAIVGEWLAGPGIEFFVKMKEAIGDFPIVAEDLGTITDGVRQLRHHRLRGVYLRRTAPYSKRTEGAKARASCFGASVPGDLLPQDQIHREGTEEGEASLPHDDRERWVAEGRHRPATDAVRLRAGGLRRGDQNGDLRRRSHQQGDRRLL